MKIKTEKEENPITLKSIIHHDPEIISAPIENELVMFSLERGMYYGMDDIAGHIWQRLEQPTSVSDLCEGLLNDFDVDRETCQHETLELLNWLYQQDLIKIDASGT
ncbi:MAG: PqqD family peptide modification chaperone [Chloroflexota bacterium]|nr:PqqD family peptide modification chaperone [Chloroflexota bacterium]